MFTDFVGPILVLLFTVLLAWSIFGYLQNDLYPLLVGAAAELIICFMLGWSSGTLLVPIPLIQFGVAGFIIYKKVMDFNKTRIQKIPNSKIE